MLPLGGDWPVFDANGTLTIDARHTYQTDDGAYIQTFESGTTQPDGSAHVRVTFETASSKYYWLNRAVGVGIIPPLTSLNFVVINYWLVSSSSFSLSLPDRRLILLCIACCSFMSMLK